MIPHHHALVPCNIHQFAATKAIIEVKSKQQRGVTLAQFPYAKALFRHLRGKAVRISAKDVRFAVGDYNSPPLVNTHHKYFHLLSIS